MLRFGFRVWGVACSIATATAVWSSTAHAISLDKDGDIKFGLRSYVNARIGVEQTHDSVVINQPITGTPILSTIGTFPRSDAGHLRQNRLFLEAEFDHNLTRLIKQGVGPLALIGSLPFKVKNLKYHLTFRGEGDGLYDWGPREYSTAQEFKSLYANDPPNGAVGEFKDGRVVGAQAHEDVAGSRKHLRQLATDRERLFQAYVETEVGDLTLRVGRQILSWGETDGFRLMDQINPIDSSFGGFLISLDERRLPLDMALATYYLGDFGPVTDSFLQGYVAVDSRIGYSPGTPAGSPWALPSLGSPSNDTRSIQYTPSRTFSEARGGAILKFNMFDATFGLAHYYTYLDTPRLAVRTEGYGRAPTLTTDQSKRGTLLYAHDDGLPCPTRPFDSTAPEDPTNLHCGAPAHAIQDAPRVQITGASATFAVPSLYSVIRTEGAFFHGEPAFRSGQIDPFFFNMYPKFYPRTVKSNIDLWSQYRSQINAGQVPQTGGGKTRDSLNFVVGLDRNQWIRFLNPNQTFFISTQFFYKHLQGADKGPEVIHLRNQDSAACRANPDSTDPTCTITFANPNREVLPVTRDQLDFFLRGSNVGRLEPIFITQPADQFLQTFFITTSYRSGTINPGFTFFYDWGGAFVYQPTVTFIQDPFRFTMDYSILDSHSLKGGSGVSLLKDRDNVQFRIEYVI